MDITDIRQILKACADDTRLRILNILFDKEPTVKQISSSLNVSQSTISKHLSRLRLIGLVIDRRKGNFVHYTLNKNIDQHLFDIIKFILSRLSDTEPFKKDIENVKTTMERQSKEVVNKGE